MNYSILSKIIEKSINNLLTYRRLDNTHSHEKIWETQKEG